MKRYVVNFIQGPDDGELLELAKDGINNGIDILNTDIWNWSVKRQVITFAADDDEYDLNNNFKKPLKMWLVDSSGNRNGRLYFKDSKTFMDEDTDATTSGTPTHYSIINPLDAQEVRLNNPPDSSFVTNHPSGHLYYFSRILHLVEDGETLDTLPEVWMFIGWYARWELAMARAQSSVSMIDRAFGAWNRWLSRLKVDDANVQTDWEI
jgi:hypothetical protein